MQIFAKFLNSIIRYSCSQFPLDMQSGKQYAIVGKVATADNQSRRTGAMPILYCTILYYTTYTTLLSTVQ